MGSRALHCLFHQIETVPMTECIESPAFATFPARFFTTIPCSDFSPTISTSLFISNLPVNYHQSEKVRSPWVTSTIFPPKLVLLTCRILFCGIGLPHFSQGYPILPANSVLSSIPGFVFRSSAQSLTGLHYLSTIHFLHEGVFRTFTC